MRYNPDARSGQAPPESKRLSLRRMATDTDAPVEEAAALVCSRNRGGAGRPCVLSRLRRAAAAQSAAAAGGLAAGQALYLSFLWLMRPPQPATSRKDAATTMMGADNLL